MSITAVIPVWNGRDVLSRLLASLESQTLQPDEVIVVDNGSTDGAPELARSRGTRVISMGRNAGFAPAVNRGIHESRTEWIAVLNSDVELAPDYFAKLSSHDAWFATGKILSANAPQLIDGSFDLVCRGGAAWRAGAGRPDGPQFSQARRIVSPPWTAALFRSALFGQAGVLEERFESYLEDVDFGFRCAALKIEGIYDPSAVAWHVGSATLGRWHSNTVMRIARNQIWLLARHYPRKLLLRWFFPIVTAQLLWGGVATRHRAGFAWLRGIIQGIGGFSALRSQSKPADEEILRTFLTGGERSIRQLQESLGPDIYWRLYFLLTGSGAL